jgi:hypothetical protein
MEVIIYDCNYDVFRVFAQRQRLSANPTVMGGGKPRLAQQFETYLLLVDLQVFQLASVHTCMYRQLPWLVARGILGEFFQSINADFLPNRLCPSACFCRDSVP